MFKLVCMFINEEFFPTHLKITVFFHLFLNLPRGHALLIFSNYSVCQLEVTLVNNIGRFASICSFQILALLQVTQRQLPVLFRWHFRSDYVQQQLAFLRNETGFHVETFCETFQASVVGKLPPVRLVDEFRVHLRFLDAFLPVGAYPFSAGFKIFLEIRKLDFDIKDYKQLLGCSDGIRRTWGFNKVTQLVKFLNMYVHLIRNLFTFIVNSNYFLDLMN